MARRQGARGMTLGERVRVAATPRVILAIGWIGFLLYAYPGFMTTEAVDQLVDARGGAYTDWHSPVMTEIWRWIDYAVSGPAPMLVVQGTLLVAGMYHLLVRAMSARAAAISASALLVFPPVLATTAVISPESLLAGFLASGAAAIASKRRVVQLAGLGLLLLASRLREGAWLAVLPIVVLGLAWRAEAAGWRRYLIAAGVWLVLVAGAIGLHRRVIDAETGRRELALATRDIAGVLRFSGPIDDAELVRAFAGVALVPAADLQRGARRWYVHVDDLTDGPYRLFDRPESPEARHRIFAARGRLVRAHVGAYLRYRWRAFARVLGLGGIKPRGVVYARFTEVPVQRVNLSFAARYSVIQRALVHLMQRLAATAVFHPFVYFGVALITLPLALVRRQRDAVMLLASALGYELAVMFVTVDVEFGSSHWMIIATALAVVMLIARGVGSRRAAGAPRRAAPSAAT
jgi:hypothetical protein